MRPVAAGGLAVLGAAPAAAAPSIGEVGINPPEDLMREHGVLNRVLLIYKEASRRIEAGEPPPAQVVDEAAWVVRRFVEDYHEALEERYVFPTLSDAGRLTSITPELCLHAGEAAFLPTVSTTSPTSRTSVVTAPAGR